MTVTCLACNATLTIPDERLPKGKVVTTACSQCKGKIVPNDLPYLGEALDQSRAEMERTYQVLRDSLRATGKA